MTNKVEIKVVGDKVIQKKEGKVISEKDYNNVLAGYRGVIHNERTSQASKEHAEQKIRELEAGRHQDQLIHEHRVIGGMKASLKNEHVSDERKQEIRNRLEEMGISY